MNFKSAPSFSLTKSLKKSITDMTPHNPIVPGPIYNVSGLGQRQSSVSHSIGKSKRTEINHRIEETPSPMHYQSTKLALGTHKSFAKSSFIETLNTNPDPACYITDEKLTTKKVLAYTLPSRYPSIMDETNVNPGPADYQPPQPLPILTKSKNSKQNAFGTDSRFKHNDSQTPGTGQYEVSSNKLSQFEQKQSLSKADKQAPIKCTPGPSDYHKMSFVETNLKSKIGKSLGGRLKESILFEKTTINAFHKYHQNPQSLFAASKSSPKYSIGKQKREFIKPNQIPGPSEYINNDFLTKHSSVALMPRSEHVEYNDSVFKPGPGTYQIQKEKGLQYSFPRSKSLSTISSNNKNNAPGVGRYQLQSLKFSNKGSSFSKSGRFLSQKQGVGVGAYDIQTKLEWKGSLSKTQRFKDHVFTTPGPGDYHIHKLIGLKNQIEK